MSNWFYICEWDSNKLEDIGKEMNFLSAKFLFRSLESHSIENDIEFALLSKGELGKVITNKDEVGDWDIISKTENFLVEEINRID